MKVPPLGTNPPISSAHRKQRKSGFTSMPPNKPSPQNPTTPPVPRVRATAASSIFSSTQKTTLGAKSLYPIHTARPPRVATRKGRADTVIGPETPLTVSPAVPTIVNRPTTSSGLKGVSRGDPEVASNPGRQTPMFFHASEIGQSPPSQTISTPKLYFADEASAGGSVVGSTNSPGASKAKVASPRLGVNVPVLTPATPKRTIANTSPSSSRPSSIARPPSPALSLISSGAERGHARFVYANGTEELLAPRKPGSDGGSSTSSPHAPTSPVFNSTYPTGAASPSKLGYPFTPAASPNQVPPDTRHGSSPRISTDLRARHGRAVSIGSISEAFRSSDEQPIADQAVQSDSEHPDIISETSTELSAGRMKIQEMEELAANARRDRKVLDLEISNASLLAINKTLEREMRKQAREIRRLKRLSRPNKLLSVPHPMTRSSSINTAVSDVSESVLSSHHGSEMDLSDLEKSSNAVSDWDEDESDAETETEENKDDEAIATEQNKRGDVTLELDIGKQHEILEGSTKMNACLKRCLSVTDELIRQAKESLEYKVSAEDVKLGGRVLTDDDAEAFSDAMGDFLPPDVGSLEDFDYAAQVEELKRYGLA